MAEAAERVTDDLRLTLGDRWICVLDEQLFLSVCDGLRLATTELTSGAGMGVAQVAGPARELLASLGIIWPVCAEHVAPATPVGGDWQCTAERHRIAEIGLLPQQHVTSPAL